MILDAVEGWIGGVGIVAGLATLAIALWQGVWRGLQHPAGRTTGLANKVLRAPLQIILGLLWIGLCYVLWRPVPLTCPLRARVIALIFGGPGYFSGLALYLWGAKTLGAMYKPASGFGVQLNAHHRLITHGPFAIVRHPMYLGLQMAALGGLLLYRTWTLLFVTVNFVALIIRARREEQALAAEFGGQWQAYRRQVPAWIPRFHREAGQ